VNDSMKLEAGEELDALVAENVMGWLRIPSELNGQQKIVVPPDGNPHPMDWWWGRSVYGLVPKYSTDIAAAWEVVERLERDGIFLWKLGREDHLPNWHVSMGRNHGPDIESEGPTAPLAICRAALAAIGRTP